MQGTLRTPTFDGSTMNAARCTQIGIDLSLYSGKTRSCLRHKCIPLVARIGPAAARIA